MRNTNRLTLRRFVLSDAEAMYKNYAADEAVTRFLSWKPYQRAEDVTSFLSQEISAYANAYTYHWAMELGGEVVGSISVIHMDEKNNSCEIGYCIGRAHWNKGIMSETVNKICEFLFLEVDMHRITAKHDVENPASGAVMKKCGMRAEGRLREHYLRHDGTYSDAIVFSMVRSEFLDAEGSVHALL